MNDAGLSRSILCEDELTCVQFPWSIETNAMTSPRWADWNLYEENGMLISNSGDSTIELEFPEMVNVVSLQLELSNSQPTSSGSELKPSWYFPPPEIPNNLGESP